VSVDGSGVVCPGNTRGLGCYNYHVGCVSSQRSARMFRPRSKSVANQSNVNFKFRRFHVRNARRPGTDAEAEPGSLGRPQPGGARAAPA
jgi:hypothetical protein